MIQQAINKPTRPPARQPTNKGRLAGLPRGGRGLLIGVEFDPDLVSAREICERLMEQGVLSKETHETVVRFAPPLIIERDEIEWALQGFFDVVKQVEKEVLPPPAKPERVVKSKADPVPA